jgi:hypothetical protein
MARRGPLSIPSEIILIDLTAYRRMVCAGCGKRGMKLTGLGLEAVWALAELLKA